MLSVCHRRFGPGFERLLLLNFTFSSKSTHTHGTCLLTGPIIIALTQNDSWRKLLARLLFGF